MPLPNPNKEEGVSSSTSTANNNNNPTPNSVNVSGKVKVGLVQMTSVNNSQTNYEMIVSFVQEAKEKDCKMLFLPECFSFIGS